MGLKHLKEDPEQMLWDLERDDVLSAKGEFDRDAGCTRRIRWPDIEFSTAFG